MSTLNKIAPWVIVAVLIALFFSYADKRSFKKDVATEMNRTHEQPKYHKDEQGTEHAVSEEHAVTREVGDAVYGKLMDSIARLNRINSEQIQEISSYKISKKSSFTGRLDTVLIHDTISIPFTFSGEGIQGEGVIKDGVVTGALTVKLQLQRLNYWKKKWLMGTPRFYEDLSSEDSTVRIDSMFNVRIKEAELSRWSLGVFAGYDLLNNRPSAGLSINFDLIRFKKFKL